MNTDLYFKVLKHNALDYVINKLFLIYISIYKKKNSTNTIQMKQGSGKIPQYHSICKYLKNVTLIIQKKHNYIHIYIYIYVYIYIYIHIWYDIKNNVNIRQVGHKLIEFLTKNT